MTAKTALTPAEKAEAIALYQTGKMSLNQIGAKFGRARQSIKKMFDKLGVVQGSAINVTAAAVEAAVVAAQVKEAAARAVEHSARVTASKEGRFKLGSLIHKMIGKIIIDSIQAGSSVGLRGNDMKALQAAGQAAKLAGEEMFIGLGIKEGDLAVEDLPALMINEMTADQINEIKNQRENYVDIDGALVAIDKPQEKPPTENPKVSEGD